MLSNVLDRCVRHKNEKDGKLIFPEVPDLGHLPYQRNESRIGAT